MGRTAKATTEDLRRGGTPIAGGAAQSQQAIAALLNVTRQQPNLPEGWFGLAKELRKADRHEEAWRADAAGIRASSSQPELLKAAVAMNAGRLEDGGAILVERLTRMPDEPAASRLLGEICWRRGDIVEAIALVERAVILAPGFDLARDFLVRLLLQSNRLPEALEQADVLVRSPMKTPAHDLLRASVFVRLGNHEGARETYEEILARRPEQPQVWQNLGHVLKTLGRQADAVHAYRRAVAYRPTMGEAWWSLANLKTVKLDAEDIATMTEALDALQQDASAKVDDVFHLHFSLGKAFEDASAYGRAFEHYDQGNRLRRTLLKHDASGFSADVKATAATFTKAFFTERRGGGCLAPDPIFIVGLPRSGSTLIEQILASHSRVEGTMELPEIMMIASRLESRVEDGEFASMAEMWASLTPWDRQRLGEEYIDRTRAYRRSDKPLFVDKMPNNWQHVGLIQLILPNAKIIDARRHPIACGFSAWKQHFARGQSFSYDLVDIGRYYRDYVMQMAAFDAAMPGKIHRVIYERMVAHTRDEVSRLLAHLQLPFEDSCLAFWENKRAVRTASSEQVRTPIFSDAVDHWRHYATELQPLTESLGSVVEAYPAVPDDLSALAPA